MAAPATKTPRQTQTPSAPVSAAQSSANPFARSLLLRLMSTRRFSHPPGLKPASPSPLLPPHPPESATSPPSPRPPPYDWSRWSRPATLASASPTVHSAPGRSARRSPPPAAPTPPPNAAAPCLRRSPPQRAAPAQSTAPRSRALPAQIPHSPQPPRPPQATHSPKRSPPSARPHVPTSQPRRRTVPQAKVLPPNHRPPKSTRTSRFPPSHRPNAHPPHSSAAPPSPAAASLRWQYPAIRSPAAPHAPPSHQIG